MCRGINIIMNKNNEYRYKKKTNKVLTKRQKYVAKICGKSGTAKKHSESVKN